MSTFAFQTPEAPTSADDFSELEQRVLRAVELLKLERSARAEAEARANQLHENLEAQTAELLRVEAELEAHKTERDSVRGRVERMLRQLDDLTSAEGAK